MQAHSSRNVRRWTICGHMAAWRDSCHSLSVCILCHQVAGKMFCFATHEASGNFSCMPRQHVKVFCQHAESKLYPCFCFQEKVPRFQSVYQVYRLCSNWLSYITKTHELTCAITKKKPHPIHFIVSSTLWWLTPCWRKYVFKDVGMFLLG